jgi:hypothetical protein
MGQQQLLLLVAGVIIAGLAVIGGLIVFGRSTDQANQDAVTQDLMTIASSAQSWCVKPAVIGGGGNKFTEFSLDKIDWPQNAVSGKFENVNGNFAVNGTPTATELKVDGTAKNGKIFTLTLQVDEKGKFTVVLTGV